MTVRRRNDQWFNEHWLRPREHERVSSATEKILQRGKPAESGRIVAELMLGFWVSLFDRYYEQQRWLWPGAVRSVFPCLTNGERGLRELSVKLNRVLKLRNRIFHHERVLNRAELILSVTDLRRLLHGMSPEAMALLADMDRFDTVWAAGVQQLPDLSRKGARSVP